MSLTLNNGKTAFGGGFEKRQRLTAQILSAWGLVEGEGKGGALAVGAAS